jgi:hypothetical protein
MAMQEQCPRESRTLQSDYYTALKNPVNPHNQACRQLARHDLCKQTRALWCQEESSRTRGKASRAILRDMLKTSMK